MNDITNDTNRLGGTMSPEQLDELEKLAALDYTPEQMAMYFGFDPVQFAIEYNDTTSIVNYRVRRGKLIVTAQEQLKMLDEAMKGSVDASKQLASIRRKKGFTMSKLDVFGGFKSEAAYERVMDYIESGSSERLSNDETIYIDMLMMIHSIDRQYGRRNTIRFLTREPFNLKHARASDMYDEAVNLFYSERRFEKKALRNKKAELLDEAARMVLENAESARDYDIYANIIMQSARLQELDKPDPEVLPKGVYQKPIRLFVLDPAKVGLPAINRHEVAAQIDALDIPERDKLRMRRDSMTTDIHFEEILDELEEESKSEE